MFLVDAAHESSRWGQNLIDKDEDGLFRRQLDALPDNVDELADSEICGDKILLLINGGNVGLLDLFANNLEADVLALDVNKHKMSS